MGYFTIPYRRIAILLICVSLLVVYANYSQATTAQSGNIADVTYSISPVGGGTTIPSGQRIEPTGPPGIDIDAMPAEGYSFKSWTASPSQHVVFQSSTAASTKATISDEAIAVTITANFVEKRILIVNVVGSGSVTKNPDLPSYVDGSSVSLTAVPAVGWIFSGWSGGISGSTNPTIVTMDSSKTIIATFIRNTYTLTVTTEGSGAVTKNPSLLSYPHGDTVSLTAVPAVGWSFSGWSGGISGSTNPATITMDTAKTVKATFIQNSYALIVNTVGSGSVTKSPNQVSYLSGSSVSLTAVPAVGWSFSGWSGAISGTANPATVTMDSAKTITATFIRSTYQVTFDTNGGGTGSNTTPSDIQTYTHGQVVPIAANVASGYRFSTWSTTGSITLANSNLASTTATINGEGTIIANFVQLNYQVSFAITGNGEINPSGVKTYPSGSVIPISAAAASSYSFASWSTTGSIIISNPDSAITSAIINGNGAITANFIQNSYSLSTSTIGSGSISKSPNQAAYYHGSSVTLTATPAAGWSFSGWMGDLTGSTNPATITLNKNMTIVANFAQDTYQVTLNVVGSGTVTPSGSQSIASGSVISISASPGNGYTFSSWSASGPITIVDENSASTTATIGGSGSIVANFRVSSQPTTNPTAAPTSNPTATLKPTIKPTMPTATPTQVPISGPTLISKTILATSDDGSSTYVTLFGDLNGSELSNAYITKDQDLSKTTLGLTLIGQNGANSFYNLTVPKGAMASDSKPTVYINNLVANSQGFMQTENYYFVWFNSPLSTYDLSVVFAAASTDLFLWPIIIAIVISIVLVVAVVLPKLRAGRKEGSTFLGSRNGFAISDYLISEGVLKLYTKKGFIAKKRVLLGEIPISQINGSERFWDELSINWNGITSTFYKRDDFKSFNELVEKVKIIANENKTANEKKEKLKMRKIETDKLISEVIPIIDTLFDLLRRLNVKRPEWSRMNNFIAGHTIDFNFATQTLPSLTLDFNDLNNSIETRSPYSVAREVYSKLKAIHEYFDKLPLKDEFPEVHPNLQDVTDLVISYYILNDVLLGKFIGKKDSLLENRSLERLLGKLAGQTNFKVNFEELKGYIDSISMESDSDNIIGDARAVFKEQISQL